MSLDIESKHYRSLEAALMWYSTATPEEIKNTGGALARIALGCHGSNLAKEHITKFYREHNVNDCNNMAIVQPRVVLKALISGPETTTVPKDHNAALGSRCEIPPDEGAVAPMSVALNDLEQPTPLVVTAEDEYMHAMMAGWC